MQEKKIPMRTCVACRRERPKREMMRIVRTPEGEIDADFSGKLAGRGAYVCPEEGCVLKLGKKKLLAKVFSAPVEDAVYRKIEEEVLGKSQT